MLFLQLLLNGLQTGAIYALTAAGFALIFGATETFHVAHGTAFTIAGYVFLFAWRAGWPGWAGIVAAVAAATLFGIAMERLVYRPIQRHEGSFFTVFVAAFGVGIVVQNIIGMIAGRGFATVDTPLSFSAEILPELFVAPMLWIALASATVLFVTLTLFLTRHPAGVALRALAQNPDLIRTYGLSSNGLSVLAFAIGSALAAPAAIVTAMTTGLNEAIGHQVMLISIAATIVGGIGSLRGAALAGMMLGIAESLALTVVDTQWAEAVSFLVLFGFIIFRPSGIFGVVQTPMTAFLINLATLAAISGILASTLNFIVGYAGIFSVAHAVFFGLGAYGGAQVALLLVPNPFLACIVAALIAGGLSLCLALPALRVRGEYFVAASLGLQMVAATLFAELKPLTGGIGGLVGIPRPELFGVVVPVLPLALVALALILWATARLQRGTFGRTLQSIRDADTAAEALGKNVNAAKTLAVAFACAGAGIAGALYALHLSFINVESFTLDQSIQIMAMVIIGGAGTLWGPLVGAVMLLSLPAVISFIPFIPPTEVGAVQQIIYGSAMTLLMIFRPAGLLGDMSKGKSTS